MVARSFSIVLVAGLVSGLPASAQDPADPMEVQRCVWRCLAESPGAESAAYQACVARHCSTMPDAPQPLAPQIEMVPAAAPRWASGPTGDGLGRYAAAFDPQRGTTFYVICRSDGRSWFSIVGPEGGDAALVLRADGGLYSLNFVERNGAYFAEVAGSAAAFQALRGAGRVTLSNTAGWPLFAVVMNGGREAIAAACP